MNYNEILEEGMKAICSIFSALSLTRYLSTLRERLKHKKVINENTYYITKRQYNLTFASDYFSKWICDFVIKPLLNKS